MEPNAIKLGVHKTPTGLIIMGFHVWNAKGEWVGVYTTRTKALMNCFRTSHHPQKAV